MKRYLLSGCLVFLISLCVNADVKQWTFANIPISEDPKAVTLGHQKTIFPKDASPAMDGVVGLPSKLIDEKASSVKRSFSKKISERAAIQTVILKSGENVTVVKGGWEYDNEGIRFVSKKEILGSTDLEKAANAIDFMQKAGLFRGSFPWGDAAIIFRNSPKKQEWSNGYPIDPKNIMNPQVGLLRVGKIPDDGGYYVELSFSMGPL